MVCTQQHVFIVLQEAANASFPTLLWKYSTSLFFFFSPFQLLQNKKNKKKSTADKHCFGHLTLVFDLVTQTVQNEQIRCLQQKTFRFSLFKYRVGWTVFSNGAGKYLPARPQDGHWELMAPQKLIDQDTAFVHVKKKERQQGVGGRAGGGGLSTK